MYKGHGDVTALIDAAGSTVATYYYDAFRNHTETTGEADNPYRYAGYQYDEETDLYYLNARYYDSKIARFMSEDTYRGEANDPLSLNLYTYCNNEPMMYSDPSGHSLLPILIGIGIVEAIVHIISGSSGSSGSGSSSKHDKDDKDDRNHQQQDNNDNVGSNNSHKATNNMNSNAPNAKAPVPVASKPSSPNCTELGDKGSDVEYIQGLLRGAGIWKVNVNGEMKELKVDRDFGKITKAAVEKFQGEHGLHVDGIVGPATLKALCQANLLGITDSMLKGGYGRLSSKQPLADYGGQGTVNPGSNITTNNNTFGPDGFDRAKIYNDTVAGKYDAGGVSGVIALGVVATGALFGGPALISAATGAGTAAENQLVNKAANTSPEVKDSALKLLKATQRGADGRFMENALNKTDKIMQNVTTGTKDVTKDALYELEAKEVMESMKDAAGDNDIWSALANVLKSIDRNIKK